jgi:FkbM family methyltransferase
MDRTTRLDRARLTAAVADLLARHTPYLDTELHTLRDLVGAGDICVDVGAAADVYTQALSHLVGPTGLVHSIEPVPFGHPVWSRILAARQRPNVRHHPVALSAEPGRSTIRVPFGRYGPGTSRSFLDYQTCGLGSNAEYPYHADMLVDVRTLDLICTTARLTRLDFVKIDVEGAELHVLHGGQQTIETFQPTMLIEIEARHTTRYKYTPEDVVQWLTRRGYTMYAWRRDWHPTNHVCPHTNNYLFRPGKTTDPARTKQTIPRNHR